VAHRQSIACGAAFALAVALGGCQWTQAAWGPEQRAYNPAESRLTPASVGGLTEVWSAPLAVNAGAQQLLAVSGRVFLPAVDGIHAVDMESGSQVWSETDPANVGMLVLVRDGVLYSAQNSGGGSCDGHLLAADAATGARLPARDIDVWTDDQCDEPVTGVFGRQTALLTGSGLDAEFHPFGTVRLYRWDTGATQFLAVGPSVRGQALDEAHGRWFQTSDGTLTAHGIPGTPGAGTSWSLFQVASTPILAPDGVVAYVQNGDLSRLAVLDPATGHELWHGIVAADANLTQGAVRAGTIFVAERGNNAVDGALLTYERCSVDSCDPAWTGVVDHELVEVVAAGDLVYTIGFIRDRQTVVVSAFAADGCGAARCEPRATASVTGDPAGIRSIVANGRVVVATSTGFHALGVP
jgi:PQQ-like domain